MENQPIGWFERINDMLSRSVTVKLFTVAIIILLLLIPKTMITSLIQEREETMKQVTDDISGKWSGSQEVSGPILAIPYLYSLANESGKIITVKKMAYFLPEKLDIKCRISPEKRSRGIYSVVVYRSEINLQGKFNLPDFESLGLTGKDLNWKEARLYLGITDLRGISNPVSVKWGNSNIDFNPGNADKNLFDSGISAPLSFHAKEDFANDYNIDIVLKGSEYLYFTPVGKETNATMSSSWNAPSFTGSFLPAAQQVDHSGFSASWKVLDYNRNYPQQWTDREQSFANSIFGVYLLIPADHYLKSLRSSKYGILVVCLTFLAFILVEIISRRRIHPVQYTLVGLALILFYILLLSVSEYLGFDWSYLIASFLIIVQITLYSLTIFGKNKASLLMLAYLVVIYGFIYSILQLENYSLLVGSLGLFIALAVTMYVTRKIKWYPGDRP